MVLDGSDWEASTWAIATFGTADVGDRRRAGRLALMARRVAEQPAGTVTGVFPTSAEREGAFRLLESSSVGVAAVADAVTGATARRCSKDGSPVFVPVDGSSLTLSDQARRRQLGRVGSRGSRGLQVMSALAVDAQGTTVGLVDQQWWRRDQPPPTRRGNDKKCFGKKFLQRETRFWLQALTRTEELFDRDATAVTRWYQLDRGADCWPVFSLAIEHSMLITVRSSHDRRVIKPDGRVTHLRSALRGQPVLGHYELDIPGRRNRPARHAQIAVRTCSVLISARVASKRRQTFRLNAVLAEEVSNRAERLRWVLLTTHAVSTFEQARSVIRGYTMRWRVEDFHRAWKRGLCNVEDTQLHTQQAIIKWATLLAAVAARALRLAHLVRHSPDLPASAEFTEYEVDAAFLFVKRKRDRRKRVLLREMIDLIADIGGFAHKYSDRLPGPTVIGRGLDRIQSLAIGLQNMEEMR